MSIVAYEMRCGEISIIERRALEAGGGGFNLRAGSVAASIKYGAAK